jgi:hypothetical protein
VLSVRLLKLFQRAGPLRHIPERDENATQLGLMKEVLREGLEMSP